MFTETLTLDDASGDDVVYALILNGANDGSKRIDTASTLSEPGVLQIKHSVSGSGPNAIDRHLVQLSRTKISAGVPRTLTVNFTVAVPRDVAITNQLVFDAVSNLVDFISDGSFSSSGIGGTTNLVSLLRGEG